MNMKIDRKCSKYMYYNNNLIHFNQTNYSLFNL